MFIYSNKIFFFLSELKAIIKQILSHEARLKVVNERFYNHEQTHSYPISVVIYNNKGMLGYFDPDFFELGFHESLMHIPRTQLWNIVRHEVAHYLAFIKYGNSCRPHGADFKAICHELGWGSDVSQATIVLESEDGVSNIQGSAVLRKVQKLMALATSSNQNEAEQALIKSQQLLLKHNLELKYIEGEDDDKVVVKRILKQKRENAKMRAIARILETFFINIVYSRGGGYIYLEILGSPVNTEIAEYVAGVLENELEKLWDQAASEKKLKGVIARNSFFLGIAKGYCNKVKSLMQSCDSSMVNGLMVIEKQLAEAKDRIYKRLTKMKSSGSYCPNSAAIGEKMGRQLTINPGLNHAVKQSEYLIGY